MKTELNSQPVYDNKSQNTKVMLYGVKINTKFHGKKIPKQGSYYVCLLIIVLHSVCQINKNYYSQVFQEECKYEEEETQIHLSRHRNFFFNGDGDNNGSEEEQNSE